MPVRDGRHRELGGLWPAFENLQRRKSRKRIRKAVPRALWRFGFCAWDSRSEPMGLSSTVDANDTRERGVSVSWRAAIGEDRLTYCSRVPRVSLFCTSSRAREALTGSGPCGAKGALADGRGRTKMA
jgi:hypothetical protein